MERSVDVELSNGILALVVFEVTWRGETYGQDADGNRGQWQEGPEIDGFDVFGEDSKMIDVATLSESDKKAIDQAINDDLEKVDSDDFEPEYDNERDL